MSKIRRSEARSRRKRLLIRVMAVILAVMVLLAFLHFVALPVMDADWMRSLRR